MHLFIPPLLTYPYILSFLLFTFSMQLLSHLSTYKCICRHACLLIYPCRLPLVLHHVLTTYYLFQALDYVRKIKGWHFSSVPKEWHRSRQLQGCLIRSGRMGRAVGPMEIRPRGPGKASPADGSPGVQQGVRIWQSERSKIVLNQVWFHLLGYTWQCLKTIGVTTGVKGNKYH